MSRGEAPGVKGRGIVNRGSHAVALFVSVFIPSNTGRRFARHRSQAALPSAQLTPVAAASFIINASLVTSWFVFRLRGQRGFSRFSSGGLEAFGIQSTW